NNLKQYGLAVHNYHDVYSKLPPLMVDAVGDPTWMVFLLPYIEQQNAYRGWNLNWQCAFYRINDATIRQAQSPTFFCPSRRQAPQVSVDGNYRAVSRITTYDIPGACSDYAAVGGGDSGEFHTEGLLRWAGGTVKYTDVQNRVWTYNSITSFATATDGLS